MCKKNILVIGSDLSVKGGISSVIKQQLEFVWPDSICIEFIPTHIDGKGLNKIAFFIKGLLHILFYLMFKKVDIVHIHMSYNGSFYRKFIIQSICKIFKKRTIIHLHGSEFEKFYYKSNNLTQKLIKKLLKNTDIFIVLGKNWDNFIKNIEPNSNTRILMNAVNIPRFNKKRIEGKVDILFLGSLIKRKGIFELIEAINNLNMKEYLTRYNVRFIIGGTGKEKESIEQKINQYNINEYIDLVGWVDGIKKIELLKKSDLFVLPSHNEGLPVAILEAISYGLPVISTNVGSIDEAVINDYNGYLIESGDIDSLEEALIKVIESSEIRNELSINAKNMAVDKFDEKKYLEDLITIYNIVYTGC